MIETPDFDPEALNHSAAEIQGFCHTVVSDHHKGEYRSDLTECGRMLPDSRFDELHRRKAFVDRGIEMCPQCWPETVRKTDSA